MGIRPCVLTLGPRGRSASPSWVPTKNKVTMLGRQVRWGRRGIVVEADPEQQIFYRQIFRPEDLREDVGGSDDERCKFCIGDVIRPVKRLADLKAYGCGEICQVVGLDDEEDPIVSYFHPGGRITEECTKRYAEHFEFAGSAALFEANPGVPHSTWMSVLNSNYRH